MKANAMELLDEINLTVAAIDEVATLLLEKESVGGSCLRSLQVKLEEGLDELSRRIAKPAWQRDRME